MSVAPELHDRVVQSLHAAQIDPSAIGEMQPVNGEPTFFFWLRRSDASPESLPFAIAAIGYKQSSGSSEGRTFSYVHSLVKAGIECLRRELLARAEILNLHNNLLEQDSGLEMLLSISNSAEPGQPHAEIDLKTIMQQATEHMQVGLSALIVPENGITLVQQSSSTPLDASLLAKAHRHLMSITRMRQTAVLLNQLSLKTDANEVTCRVVTAPVLRADGRSVGVLALFRAAAAPEFNQNHARLTELLSRRVASIIANSYDVLTGLLTRSAFERRVGTTLKERANTTKWWSALHVDINRMHLINDNLGMHVGDRVISELGDMLRKRLPPGAIAARTSGDRFAVLLPAGLDDARKFAESLRQAASEISRSLGESRLDVSVSIGVAAVEPSSPDYVHTFAAAETACKAANDRGRNRVEVYQEVDESIVRRFTDINLIAEVRSAVAENRFDLNAQLIAPLQGSGGAPHFEILLRMRDAKGELVGPDSFLSAAMRYQLMPTIDRWVIRRSLEMLKPHKQILKDSSLVFNINFSGQSLLDASFGEEVVRQVVASGIPPASLCFELTESTAIGNLERAEELMRRLRKLGCDIALDDFGTGLSSLAYLRTLPIGMLKIDGSFVRDVLKDARASAMVQVIAQLARAMSLTTVAEYVETDEIRTRVTELGVDLGQGFAIARPVPLADILSELPLYAAAASPQAVWHAADSPPAAASA